MAKRWVLAATITILLVGGLVFFPRTKEQAVILPNGQSVKVEIADNNLTRAKGLMYRDSLDEHSGMFFIFEREMKHIFWMKNTLIPLDMLWINSNFEIVDILRDVPPCTTESCQSYMPAQQAKYVLEVNAGYSEKQNLKIGDKIELK